MLSHGLKIFALGCCLVDFECLFRVVVSWTKNVWSSCLMDLKCQVMVVLSWTKTFGSGLLADGLKMFAQG